MYDLTQLTVQLFGVSSFGLGFLFAALAVKGKEISRLKLSRFRSAI